MQRVVILGRGGAGKSVFARELGARTSLTVIELDKEYWNSRLEPLPKDEWERRQIALVGAPRWIMDGDLGPYDVVEPRFRRADTVVVLDLPLWLCAWRAVRRGRERRDFWDWTMRWRSRSRPRLLDAVERFAPDAELVVLRHRRAVRRWLDAAVPA